MGRRRRIAERIAFSTPIDGPVVGEPQADGIQTIQFDPSSGVTITGPPRTIVGLTDEALLRLGELAVGGALNLTPAKRLALVVLQGDRPAALVLADMVQEEWARANQ